MNDFCAHYIFQFPIEVAYDQTNNTSEQITLTFNKDLKSNIELSLSVKEFEELVDRSQELLDTIKTIT